MSSGVGPTGISKKWRRGRNCVLRTIASSLTITSTSIGHTVIARTSGTALLTSWGGWVERCGNLQNPTVSSGLLASVGVVIALVLCVSGTGASLERAA